MITRASPASAFGNLKAWSEWWKLAVFVAEYGVLGAELYNYFGGDLDQARQAMTDRYLGCYTRLADYMERLPSRR